MTMQAYTEDPRDYEPRGVAIGRCPTCGHEHVLLVASRRCPGLTRDQAVKAMVATGCFALAILTILCAALAQ